MGDMNSATTETFPTVRACVLVLLAGVVLHGSDVTAGNGIIVDWRTVKCGEEIRRDADPFDTAQLFVALVGVEVAARAVEDAVERNGLDIAPPPPVPRVAPRVVAFAPDCNGGRRRQFDVGAFTIRVEPHEDDAAQAEFTARLAALCESLSA
jgi:hypothetical protein